MVRAQHDENVFGKVGCSAAEFEKALTGKKVMGARQQGKYFWLVKSSFANVMGSILFMDVGLSYTSVNVMICVGPKV